MYNLQSFQSAHDIQQILFLKILILSISHIMSHKQLKILSYMIVLFMNLKKDEMVV